MSRSKNLRKLIANQIIDDLSQGNIESPLPSQTILADLYSVSRTTIRNIINEFVDKKLLIETNDGIVLSRKPDSNDKYKKVKKTTIKQPKELVEKYLNYAVNSKKIQPGDLFTERELASEIGISVKEVHEQLIILSRFKILKLQEHGLWEMTPIDVNYVNKLYDLRLLIENHSIKSFMQLPKDDIRWTQAKYLLEQHKNFDKKIINDYREFSNIDREFHKLILSASDNVFMDEYFETISMIFHLQYQWDDHDLRNRNQIAISEHISILCKILSGNYLEAKDELEIHLKTAKKSFENSLIEQ